jgi:hypothetical protein
MKVKMKWALLGIGLGMIALSSGGCWFGRLLGDLAGDTFWLRAID